MVGIKPLRELLGVMASTNIPRGVFVTSSCFSREAECFATDNGIHLLDGAAIVSKILARPPADRDRLLNIATEGAYLTPSCPSCGIKLVSRRNKQDDTTFWGCANYPRRRFTLPC